MASNYCISLLILLMIRSGACDEYDWTGCGETKFCMITDTCSGGNKYRMNENPPDGYTYKTCDDGIMFKALNKQSWMIEMFSTGNKMELKSHANESIFVCTKGNLTSELDEELTITRMNISKTSTHCEFNIDTSESSLAEHLQKLRKIELSKYPTLSFDVSRGHTLYDFNYDKVQTKVKCDNITLSHENCYSGEICGETTRELLDGSLVCEDGFAFVFKDSNDSWKPMDEVYCDFGTHKIRPGEIELTNTSEIKCVQKKFHLCPEINVTGDGSYHKGEKIDEYSTATCNTKLMIFDPIDDLDDNERSFPRYSENITCNENSEWTNGTDVLNVTTIKCVESVDCNRYQPVVSDCKEYRQIAAYEKLSPICYRANLSGESPTCSDGVLHYLNAHQKLYEFGRIECDHDTGLWRMYMPLPEGQLRETPKFQHLRALCIGPMPEPTTAPTTTEDPMAAFMPYLPIGGGVLGLIILIIIIVVLCKCVCKKKRKKNGMEDSTGSRTGKKQASRKPVERRRKMTKIQKTTKTSTTGTTEGATTLIPASNSTPAADKAPTPANTATPAADKAPTPTPTTTATPAADKAPTPTPTTTATPAADKAPTPTPTTTATPAADQAPRLVPANIATPAADKAPTPTPTTTATPAADKAPTPTPAPSSTPAAGGTPALLAAAAPKPAPAPTPAPAPKA